MRLSTRTTQTHCGKRIEGIHGSKREKHISQIAALHAPFSLAPRRLPELDQLSFHLMLNLGGKGGGLSAGRVDTPSP